MIFARNQIDYSDFIIIYSNRFVYLMCVCMKLISKLQSNIFVTNCCFFLIFKKCAFFINCHIQDLKTVNTLYFQVKFAVLQQSYLLIVYYMYQYKYIFISDCARMLYVFFLILSSFFFFICWRPLSAKCALLGSRNAGLAKSSHFCT